MQVIDEQYADLRCYVEKDLHEHVRAPQCCPCCDLLVDLCKWGYYERWVIGRCEHPKCCLIKVRRFRCPVCEKTISLLPGFAQPHHQMSNDLIEDFVLNRQTAQLLRYKDLWEQMLRRFSRWKEHLLSIIGYGLGRSPPVHASSKQVLVWLWQGCGKSFNNATARLTKGFYSSVFGQYRCHKPTQIGEDSPI